MCLQRLKALLSPSVSVPTPKLPLSTKRIENNLLRIILQKAAPDADLFLSDRNYLLCNLDDIEYFLAQDQTNRYQYKAESFDCDDFAYRLMGQFSIPSWADLAFGIIWTDLHALNCFIDENYFLYFVEPQKDTIATSLAPWQGSKIRFITM